MRKKLYALVDCSAFYCSCERAFRADLKGKPICVLSNNDGCIISLTPEVKELGFRMGTPYYQVRKELERLGVSVFSSNYCLYADMSKRVVRVIRSFSDYVEQYSIDEAFVEFEADTERVDEERIRLEEVAREMHKTILRKTGIPVRVSIAETKTLAKVGSEYTKMLLKQDKVPSVCFWEHPDKETFMRALSVSDVWGIGRQWSKKLEGSGIRTAYDLSKADAKALRKSYNVVMEKTAVELTGISCLPLELIVPTRKSLVRSRMFSKKINDPKLIRQAISTHLARAAEKLRKDRLMASQLSVFISTGRHTNIRAYQYASQILLRPTNDTFVLGQIAQKLFDECYKKADNFGNDYQYSKAGVALSDFTSVEAFSVPLIEPGYKENPALMQTVDLLNKRFGKHSIVTASMGLPDKLKKVESGTKGAVEWGMKRQMMSERFTTVWDELLKVKI